MLPKPSMTNKISVHIRVRSNCKHSEWEVKDNVLYQILDKTTKLSYICYQNVFYKSKTLDIYSTSVKEVVNELSNGVNSTIFAYGQTGSGKTHTMLGTEMEPGIIKLSLIDILLNNKEIEISYLEIYNENVHDLIESKNTVKMYNSNTKVCLANVSKIKINDIHDAMEIIYKCEKRRKVGQTEYNERSSRSHTIFQVFIKNANATLSLIDLAGSEKAAGSIERRKEGAYINRSLLALGSVINKLIKNEYVSFRDSKLTRILQHSLDGNSNVVSLCMISPTNECLSESINTLKFAARLSKVELQERKDRMVFTEEKKVEMCCRCNKTAENDFPTAKSIENKINFNKVIDPIINIDDRHENMLLKAENELYKERVRSLEETVSSLLSQTDSKRMSDLFSLEKNMFQLQLEIIKRKKKKDIT